MLLIGGIVVLMLFNKVSKVGKFSVADYSNYIAKFSSSKVLGSIDNAGNAKKKAESLWLEIYGESVKKEKPYQVFYDDVNEAWLVSGSLQQSLFCSVKGGVAYIIIRKSDGKVLAVWHDK